MQSGVKWSKVELSGLRKIFRLPMIYYWPQCLSGIWKVRRTSYYSEWWRHSSLYGHCFFNSKGATYTSGSQSLSRYWITLILKKSSKWKDKIFRALRIMKCFRCLVIFQLLNSLMPRIYNIIFTYWVKLRC